MAKPLDRLKNYFVFLEWVYVVSAVLKVVLENWENHAKGTCEIPHDADIWSWDADSRGLIWKRVRKYWCEYTGKPKYLFPYNETCLAKTYLYYRKRNDEEMRAFVEECEERMNRSL